MTGGPWQRRAGYRIRQFVQGVRASLTPLSADEEAQVRRVLPAGAWPLFAAMSRNDQRHSLRVMTSLLAAGHDHPALLQAALLHDAAKAAAGLTLFHRSVIVLLRAARPGLLSRWTAPRPRPGDFRYAFWVHEHHAERGAELAAEAGCDALAVALIRNHQDGPGKAPGNGLDELLAVLQAADDNN